MSWIFFPRKGKHPRARADKWSSSEGVDVDGPDKNLVADLDITWIQLSSIEGGPSLLSPNLVELPLDFPWMSIVPQLHL